MEGTPKEGMDVAYSWAFRFHSPYIFWVGEEGILGRMLVRSKDILSLAKKLMHWKHHGVPLVEVAFKIGMNSERRSNRGTQGC